MIWLAAGGSLVLLLGAWGFEFLGGLAPCKLCYWQRWPHMAAIIVGVLATATALRWFPLVGAAAAATTASIGIYHTGVERAWWPGPSSCSGGGDLGGLSGADLLSLDGPSGVVMCDQVAWSMLGLSMASWNAIASLLFMALWIMATLRPARHPQTA
nr:disulfide bond formation protein B [Actibacterium sp. 188UL27-1]